MQFWDYLSIVWNSKINNIVAVVDSVDMAVAYSYVKTTLPREAKSTIQLQGGTLHWTT